MIGVVGGLGPAAGLDLCQKLLQETPAGGDQDHLDVVMLSRPSAVADRTAFLVGASEVNPGWAIADHVDLLVDLGATTIGVPCNTAHAPAIFDVVTRRAGERGATVVNMVREAVAAAGAVLGPDSPVGVLATTGTHRSGVYADALRAARLRPLLLPAVVHDRLVQPAVYDPRWGVKAAGPNPAARAQVLEAVERLVDSGAEGVLLACTELPLVVPEPGWRGVRLLDPTRALARSLVRRTLRPLGAGA